MVYKDDRSALNTAASQCATWPLECGSLFAYQLLVETLLGDALQSGLAD